MRHGKAADISDYANDFDRPLVIRGIEEAALAAEKLRIVGIIPDFIIASPAQRTKDTAQSVCKIFGRDRHDFITEISLYGGSFFDYLDAIAKYDYPNIMLIGHNPEIGRLSMHYSKNEIHSFPTSSCAAFRFESLQPDKNSIAELLYYDLRK